MRYAAMRELMRLPIAYWLAAVVLLFVARVVLADPYKPDPGAYTVQTFTLELLDEDRDREVPIRVYMPEDAEGPLPVVLVSHGLGGSRDGLSYLGNHWASHGFVCVHMQHLGSDDSVWRGLPPAEILSAMREAARDPDVALNRAMDVPFVLDQLELLAEDEDSSLHAMLDMARVGIAGHSFGAWSAMAGGGMTIGGRRGLDYSDDRIRCMIPLSPPCVSRERLYEVTYSTLDVPALFMTGTLDTSVINGTTPEERTVPYEFMPGPSEDGEPKYLIFFDGADHMTFGGPSNTRRNRDADPETEPIFHDLILQSTTAFLDAYLLGNDQALDWLNGGAFDDEVGEHGEVTMETD